MAATSLNRNNPDTLFRALEVIFACSQSAWDRRDFAAHQRAAEMYKKYQHLWRQAKARSSDER